MNRNEKFEPEAPTEKDHTENLDRKTAFIAKLHNKLMAMALAGFITLGGGLEKGYAEQLKVSQIKNEAPQFLLESAISPDRLKTFEEKLKKEEPRFIEWLVRYSKTVSDRLDDLANEVSDFKEAQGTDQIFAVGDGEAFPPFIYRDHELLENIKKEPGTLKNYQQFLKNNLYNIVLAISFLDNSKMVRGNMIALVEPPNFIFTPHIEGSYAITSPLPRDRNGHYIKTEKTKKWEPEIIFTTQAFGNKGKLDLNLYVNVFIHELVHALHPGAKNLADPSKNSSGLTPILEEGLSQNMTLEIVQQLSLKNTRLKPGVGLVDYDERVLFAAILEGISRSKENNDTLSRWHTKMIDDSELAGELTPILEDLGLDKGIAWDLKETGPAPHFGDSGTEPALENRKSYKMLLKLLSRLKMGGMELSPAFIESILIKGRTLDGAQVKAVKDKFKSLPE